MPQPVTRSQTRKNLSRLKRFVLLSAVVSSSFITLAGLPTHRLTALASANKAKNSSTWAAASFPLENFQAYTSPFGWRQSPFESSGWQFHRGIDMAAPEGSYIRNWWTGTVVEVSDNTGCGTSVVIKSGEWQHTYCHMKGRVEAAAGSRYMIDREGGIQIWQGQQISAGTRIGRVGMTGRTTGPHLHWGLKYANNYVDPAQVLQAMYAQQGNRQWATTNIGGRD